MDEHFAPAAGMDLHHYLKARDICGVHHVIRYLWAGRIITARRPMSILDIACGSGYGTHYLAQLAPWASVVGADYDPSAVQRASAQYSLPNLQFRFGDVTSWRDTIGSTRFDCIVSFDTIEHVGHRELMMENVVRQIQPNGIMLLSTPSSNADNVLKPSWEFHKLEYCAASLYDFLRRYFGTVIGGDMDGFPSREVWDVLSGTDVHYPLLMNPVVCLDPIAISNPYRQDNRSA